MLSNWNCLLKEFKKLKKYTKLILKSRLMQFLKLPQQLQTRLVSLWQKWLWKIPVYVIIAVILTAAVYVAYVFITFSRIEDNLVLEPEGNAGIIASAGEKYTIVSYNVGYGANMADYSFFMDGGKESRARSKESVINCISGAAETALSFDPDIVLIQEADTDSTRSFHVEQRELINGIFAQNGSFDNVFAQNYHSAYLMYPLTEPIGASYSGILTESRLKISSALRRSLPIATGFKKFLDLDRCYSICRIPTDNGKELVIINQHMSAYGTDAAQGSAQLEKILSDMQTEYEQGNYVICGGDFNHDFTTTSIKYFNPDIDESFSWTEPFPDDLIPEGFVKCDQYTGDIVPTARHTNEPYNENSLTVILDGFIVSDNISVISVQNVDKAFEFTDHNPVVMEFRLQ